MVDFIRRRIQRRLVTASNMDRLSFCSACYNLKSFCSPFSRKNMFTMRLIKMWLWFVEKDAKWDTIFSQHRKAFIGSILWFVLHENIFAFTYSTLNSSTTQLVAVCDYQNNPLQSVSHEDPHPLPLFHPPPPHPPPCTLPPPRNLPLWSQNVLWGVPNIISLIPRTAIGMHRSYSLYPHTFNQSLTERWTQRII